MLFADLVGFTPFAEERDPEQVRDVLERYFASARTVIERHGGTVEKFIGDAVMAVWGTPTAHEDDPERAVRAALELLPAVRAMDERMAARAAVLTGEAAINVGAADQGIVAGDLVNTCARLQSVAASGTVLVGESTMRAASRAIAFEQAGEKELKGKLAPVPAWRALRVVTDRGGRRTSDALEPPFVGRDAEMTLLKDLLHATSRERRARLVLVTGPAGIGKSRLAWELQKYLDGLVEGVYWHRGRSPSYGEGISYWALGEMVRRRCGLAENDDEEITRRRVAETVAEFVPAEEDRRWVLPALLALLGVEEAPAGGRDVLFAAWRIFFERIAARGTTVLLFEDLQFADSGLLDFLDHLLEWSKGMPILVLALARPELFERRPGFGTATRHYHSLPLEPLPPAQMRELLEGLVPGLPHAMVDAIVERADGIPLYAVETIRMLIADGRIEAAGGGRYRPTAALGTLAVPDTLRSLILSRLDALPAEERAVIQQAAVLGQSFSPEALAAVSGKSREDLASRLRSLVRRDILTLQADPRSPERGQYSFVQGLIREVAYATLGRRERRARHLAAARYLEALRDGEVAGALANHYLAAYRASDGDPEADALAAQARIALRGAAERAGTLGAHDQELAYLVQALEVAPDARDRTELLECAASAAQAAARYEEAEQLARRAKQMYGELGEPLLVARAAGLVGTILVDASRLSDAIVEMETALAGLAGEAPEMRADLESRLARAYMRLNQAQRAIEAADRALVIAEPRALQRVIAEALINKGSALGFSSRPVEGAALLEAARNMARRAGIPASELRALNNLAAVVVDNDPLRADQLYAETLDLSRRLGQRGLLNFVASNFAWGRWITATDWDRALAVVDEALDAASNRLEQARVLVPAVAIKLARGERPVGELARIESLLHGADDPVVAGSLQWLHSERAFLDGQFDRALEHAEQGTRLDIRNTGITTQLLRAAIGLRNRGQVEHAIDLIRSQPRTGRIVAALLPYAEAALAALDGSTEAAAGFHRAFRTWLELGLEGVAAVHLIDALMLLPDDAQLLEMAGPARVALERVGAKAYLERLDRLAQRAPACHGS
ncbi:MAG: AAA family ATPase [Chloroflexota bacterium]|nr:AAA family ATPase [Chloroflexota bacterium]